METHTHTQPNRIPSFFSQNKNKHDLTTRNQKGAIDTQNGRRFFLALSFVGLMVNFHLRKKKGVLVHDRVHCVHRVNTSRTRATPVHWPVHPSKTVPRPQRPVDTRSLFRCPPVHEKWTRRWTGIPDCSPVHWAKWTCGHVSARTKMLRGDVGLTYDVQSCRIVFHDCFLEFRECFHHRVVCQLEFHGCCQ